jgi:hypothetical protein
LSLDFLAEFSSSSHCSDCLVLQSSLFDRADWAIRQSLNGVQLLRLGVGCLAITGPSAILVDSITLGERTYQSRIPVLLVQTDYERVEHDWSLRHLERADAFRTSRIFARVRLSRSVDMKMVMRPFALRWLQQPGAFRAGNFFPEIFKNSLNNQIALRYHHQIGSN